SYFVLDAGIDLRNFSGSANGPSTTQSGTIDLGEGDGTPLTLAPEPASVLLLGLALLGILVVARRFRWAM
ncbi:MAG: PEP-CTERM sorting domain-containing protein, partial [Terracidiphilus sp.]